MEHENAVNTREELIEKRNQIKNRQDLIDYLTDIEQHYNTDYNTAPEAIAQACLAVAYYLGNKFGRLTTAKQQPTEWRLVLEE